MVLDVVFRVLTAIHELVVDREMQQLHSAGELARNAHIKGAMRAHAVDVIADTWYGMSPIGPCYLYLSCSLLFPVSRLFVCSEGQPSREHPCQRSKPGRLPRWRAVVAGHSCPSSDSTTAITWRSIWRSILLSRGLFLASCNSCLSCTIAYLRLPWTRPTRVSRA